MDVRPVNASDAAQVDSWFDVYQRGWTYQRPWENLHPKDTFTHLLTTPMEDEFHEGYLAIAGDQILGAMLLTVPTMSNTDKITAELAVAPEHRRRGAGSLLLEQAFARTQELGATYTRVPGSYSFADRGTHFTHAFAAKVGLRLDIDEIQRRRPLPIDPTLLDRLAAQAAAQHTGYRIETWQGEIPEELFDSWADTENALGLDAPAGELPSERDSWNRETWRDLMAYIVDTGQQMLNAVAISPSNEVVAVSDLAVRKDRTTADQWGTLVRRDHRGHRLGLAVKVANLQQLARLSPDTRQIDTINAEVNEQMIEINRLLGFEPIAVLPMWYRRS